MKYKTLTIGLCTLLTGCSTWYNKPFNTNIQLDTWNIRITDSKYIERNYGYEARGVCDSFRKEIIAEYNGSTMELERNLGHELLHRMFPNAEHDYRGIWTNLDEIINNQSNKDKGVKRLTL